MNEHENTIAPEVWKPTPQYFDYEVSSLGRVRRISTGRIVSADMADGYPRVNLWMPLHGKGVRRYSHVLVASAFIGPKPQGMEVNHIDGCKTNCTPGNLEYVTPSQNVKHAHETGLKPRHPRGERHYNSKFSDLDVLMIRLSAALGESQRKIASQYGTKQGSISSIVCRKTRASV